VLESAGAIYYTPEEHCGVFTWPSVWHTQATVSCGNDQPDDNGYGNNDVTTVTYTYTTDGALIVVETTMGVVGNGPFRYNAEGKANRIDGSFGIILGWIWGALALVAGAGMVIL
jgi:hypothetical protein